MIPESLQTDLRKGYRTPTEEEIDLVLREGTLADVGNLVSITHGKDKRATKRLSQMHREAQMPKAKTY